MNTPNDNKIRLKLLKLIENSADMTQREMNRQFLDAETETLYDEIKAEIKCFSDEINKIDADRLTDPEIKQGLENIGR